MDGNATKNSSSARTGQGRTLAAALALLLVFCWRTQAAQTLSVVWNPSPDKNVAGYMVYYGESSGDYTGQKNAGTNTSITISGLREGQTNYIIVKAYNAHEVESPPSNEISYIVPGILNVAPKAQLRSPAEISFPVAPGHSYQVQASVNLRTWSTIWQTTSTTNGWMQYQDPQGANLKMRFYRLVMQ